MEGVQGSSHGRHDATDPPKGNHIFQKKILQNLPKPIHSIKTTDDNDTKLYFTSLMAMMVNMMLKAIRLCFKSTKKKCSEFRQFSPKVAAEVAAPLSQAKKITMVSKKNRDRGLKR